MTQPTSGSPTVRRLKLGSLLREAREAAGLTLDEAADAIGIAPRNLRRRELGQVRSRPPELRPLAKLYQVSVEALAEWETLAKQAQSRGWWVDYRDALTSSFTQFLGLEAEASSFMGYQVAVVPGLLQTEAYMRTVIAAELPRLDDATIDKRVKVRLRRQREMLSRNSPCHFVISQAALLCRVGSDEIMAAQLGHLLDLARSHLLTIQVVPFEAGPQSILWSFTVLTFNEMPPVACIELLRGDLYADDRESQRYFDHFISLREGALPVPLSLALVRKIKKEYENAAKEAQ